MILLLDTHQHLIYRNELNYEWTKNIPILSKNDFTAEDYNSLVKGLGVGGSLFMEADADNYNKEVQFIKTLAKNSNNKIRGIIASIRPEKNEEFESWLDESIEMGVSGYRRILHEVSDEISQTNTFRKNIRKIGDANKTFDLCFLQKQLPLALELAQKCENTIFILDHCGVPDIARGDINDWSKSIADLSKLPNVYCKLSGIMAYCPPGTASLETIDPYVDTVLNFFGPNRIMWGSDWPVVNLAKGLSEWIAVTREILSKLTEDEANAIANQTAQSIYKVNI